MTTKWYVLFVLGAGVFAWALERQGHSELGLLLFGLSMTLFIIAAGVAESVSERMSADLKSVRDLLQELVDDPALQRRKHEHRMEWLEQYQRLEALKRGGQPVSDFDLDDAYCRAHGLSPEAAEKYKSDMHAHRRDQRWKEEDQKQNR